VKTFIARGVADFCARKFLHDSFVGKYIYIYQHCEDISKKMGRRGKLSVILFLPIMNLLLNVLRKMGSRIL